MCCLQCCQSFSCCCVCCIFCFDESFRFIHLRFVYCPWFCCVVCFIQVFCHIAVIESFQSCCRFLSIETDLCHTCEFILCSCFKNFELYISYIFRIKSNLLILISVYKNIAFFIELICSDGFHIFFVASYKDLCFQNIAVCYSLTCKECNVCQVVKSAEIKIEALRQYIFVVLCMPVIIFFSVKYVCCKSILKFIRITFTCCRHCESFCFCIKQFCLIKWTECKSVDCRVNCHLCFKYLILSIFALQQFCSCIYCCCKLSITFFCVSRCLICTSFRKRFV